MGCGADPLSGIAAYEWPCNYIEDLDSLRFALGVVDYDVTKLQPHFPAYPVFCFFAKAIYALTDRYAVAFFLPCWAAQRLLP